MTYSSLAHLAGVHKRAVPYRHRNGTDSQAYERIQYDATAGSRERSVALSARVPYRAKPTFSHQAAAMAASSLPWLTMKKRPWGCKFLTTWLNNARGANRESGIPPASTGPGVTKGYQAVTTSAG